MLLLVICLGLFRRLSFSAVCEFVWCVSLDTALIADLGLMYTVLPLWFASEGPSVCVLSW